MGLGFLGASRRCHARTSATEALPCVNHAFRNSDFHRGDRSNRVYIIHAPKTSHGRRDAGGAHTLVVASHHFDIVYCVLRISQACPFRVSPTRRTSHCNSVSKNRYSGYKFCPALQRRTRSFWHFDICHRRYRFFPWCDRDHFNDPGVISYSLLSIPKVISTLATTVPNQRQLLYPKQCLGWTCFSD